MIAMVAVAASWISIAQAAPTSRFEQLRQQDLRVATVAYRLSLSSRAVCPRSAVPQLGFVLHSLAQYSHAEREAAASGYGLARGVGVMAVVAGSPAALAGLEPNDQLVSVNGVPLPQVESSGGRASVERAETIIREQADKGAVSIRVARAQGERQVQFAAELGCPTDVELVTDGNVNAWADGARVMVTSAILGQCRSDDELAIVIAHEMAHNLLHHRRRLAAAGVEMGLLPVASTGTAKMRETEVEADQFAVRMARAAGYDLTQAVPFLARLLGAKELNNATATHPTAARRLALLRAAIASSAH